MADKKKGFVPVYRAIQDHWLWNNDEPFSKGQAWIDLMLSVNHEEKKILINGRVVVIKPGQRWTSYRTLAKSWGWSKDRVKRYIKLLKSDGMILTDETPSGTLLTLTNWENFNSARDTKRDTNKDTDKDTHKDTDKDTGKDETIIRNNDNNVKNVNKKDRSVCPGKGWYWDDEGQRWIAPPKEGEEWQ